MKFTLLALCCIIQSIYGCDDSSLRIIGGQNAECGIAPYMCALNITILDANILKRKLCGCSILTNKWVLTAAHCIEGYSIPQYSTVLVGTNHLHDSNDTNDEETRKYYQVEQWIGHQHWENSRKIADIAVVQVKGEIEFNEKVQPIAFSSNPVPVNVNVQLTGWGRTDWNGKSPSLLQILNMTIVSAEECRKHFRNIDDSHLCARIKHGGACKGDSGGPLVWNNEVVGVVSYGQKGCPGGYSNVFARVSHFYDWIKEQISQT